MAIKVSPKKERRIMAAEEHPKDEGGYGSIAKKYGVSKTTFRDYMKRARAAFAFMRFMKSLYAF